MQARGDVVGDGVRIHSMALPGLVSSLDVRFAGPGEVQTGILNLALVSSYFPFSFLLSLQGSELVVLRSCRRCLFGTT